MFHLFSFVRGLPCSCKQMIILYYIILIKALLAPANKLFYLSPTVPTPCSCKQNIWGALLAPANKLFNWSSTVPTACSAANKTIISFVFTVPTWDVEVLCCCHWEGERRQGERTTPFSKFSQPFLGQAEKLLSLFFWWLIFRSLIKFQFYDWLWWLTHI